MIDLMKFFPEVLEHLNQPLPETLWHYTSFDGFLGILNTQQIWSSEIRHLNDTTEFLHGREIVESELQTLLSTPDDQESTARLTANVLSDELSNGLLGLGKLNLFAVSFSENGDQLSQWRGYTPSARGISIGFDLSHLRPDRNSGAFQFLAPCVYDYAMKKSLITHCIKRIRETAFTWRRTAYAYFTSSPEDLDFDFERLPNELRQPLHDAAFGLGISLAKIVPLFKHPSFLEEQEWRLVGTPEPSVPKGAFFLRVGSTGFVPTIRNDLRKKDGALPIKHVRVGPCPSPDLQIRAIELLLKHRGLDYITVSKSLSTFRAW